MAHEYKEGDLTMTINGIESMKQVLIHLKEGTDVELKKAKKGLPESFWESYGCVKSFV
jgi:hypothetical protein